MRSVALLLPGQGAQYAGMSTDLYGEVEVFTTAMDEVFDALGPDGDQLRADWLSDSPSLPIDHVIRSQPLLFAIDYAYGTLVRSWGVEPAALLGHSIGEMAAAVLAGVFTIGDASRLVWTRMSGLADAVPGGMIAVAQSAQSLAPLLGGQVVVGAVNAPRQTILAGPRPELDSVAAELTARGITCRPVASLTPFHSPALAGFVAADRRQFATVPMRAPAMPIYSCYTAAVLRPDQAVDPGYWASHPVATVRFWPALETLLASGDYLLLEAGPGRSLTTLARRHPAVRSGRSQVLALTPDPHQSRSEIFTIAQGIASGTHPREAVT
ncbi:acyltransferase domain-containing protein [Actinocrispum wychmicini]|uniref:Acyl transferase family protein n=1 Tax=Actinocrispum wychmicini TaxID=1213861 RepID=A0A4R2JXB6_9PSEU|nr:acyltransferase domain-containing protein [Actinocrispum wychmicini]TCO62038.1 acyl transferase family protein [Actinocrispum wychmicini]